MSYFEKIKSYPDGTKKTLSIVFALLITALLVLVYAFIWIPWRAGDLSSSFGVYHYNASDDLPGSPLEILGESLNFGLEGIRSSLDKLGGQ